MLLGCLWPVGSILGLLCYYLLPENGTFHDYVLTVGTLGFLAYVPCLLLSMWWLGQGNQSNVSEDKEATVPSSSSLARVIPILTAVCLWIGMCIVPLAFTCGAPRYRSVFPKAWFDEEPVAAMERWFGLLSMAGPGQASKRVLGLCLGIIAVIVGQVVVVFYHWLRRVGLLGEQSIIQTKANAYNFKAYLKNYISQPGGFALIGGYLTLTWMLGIMPASYYSFGGGITWAHVCAQLLLQDFFQYVMHLGEHKISMWLYRHSHKPHHRFTRPCLFDAFDGSVGDTFLMILIPFSLTARLVPSNVWSYMAFGSVYSCWLSLIHSEYVNLWDSMFHSLGLGTAADHHVHHSVFNFNFGHLFMYWDRMLGTYKDPSRFVGRNFNKAR
mmetsp:Transcript_91382/g.142662  ORF Transcript_91382/g.142662 Transcript_91382/m.142662 type:complete len:383 (+) Transcript_91382:58-1206(+)